MVQAAHGQDACGKAELTEQEREHRDISQEALADISGVAPHNLRKWAEWYRAEGVRVLRARGGQGRKPDASHEDMEAAIENGQEKSGLQSSPSPRGRGRQLRGMQHQRPSGSGSMTSASSWRAIRTSGGSCAREARPRTRIFSCYEQLCAMASGLACLCGETQIVVFAIFL